MAEVRRLPQKEPPPFETCDWCVGANCVKRRSCALWRDAGGEHCAEVVPWDQSKQDSSSSE